MKVEASCQKKYSEKRNHKIGENINPLKKKL